MNRLLITSESERINPGVDCVKILFAAADFAIGKLEKQINK